MWSSGACVDLVYIVILRDYRERSHTHCSIVDIPGTPFYAHCQYQMYLQCVENENIVTGYEKWIAIFANSRFY